ncbi:sugar transferase [Aeribacillus pallidus]|uniref:sugar transferase n=1 Tax=Aeribacillus pallidus TaxID=33936 RepID=UPI003D1F0532
MKWKRLFDFFTALFLIILFMPIILCVALLVKIYLGSPILFKQLRPGLNAKPFYIYKFRTMTNDKDEQGNLLPEEKRVTRFGNLLRKYSLDELPQLFNVIKGDLSLVGPRPLFTKYLPYYTEREMKRHSVKPGITGLSQISGRNLLGWDERLELDVKYVEERSFWLDMKILLITVIKVFKKDGVAEFSNRPMLDLDEERRLKNKERDI